MTRLNFLFLFAALLAFAFTANAGPACLNVSIPTDVTVKRNNSVVVPINVDSVTGLDVISFDYTLTYDPSVVTFQGFDQTGTLSSGMIININPSPPGTVVFSGYTPYPLTGSGALIKLNFMATGPIGSFSLVSLPTFMFNENTPCSIYSNGKVTIVSGNVSGVVSYANSPTFKPVPNTVLNAPGTPLVSANSAFLTGAYSLGGFGPGTYTATPSKTGDVNGITGFDSGLIAQYVVGLITLNPTQLLAADVSQASGVTGFDAALIARYVVSLPSSGVTSNWIFSPSSRTYPPIETDQTNQDYSGILMGEVSGNWVEPTSFSPLNDIPAGPIPIVNVTAPNQNAGVGTMFTVPVTTSDLSPLVVGTNVISYQFDLTYNQNVIVPQSPAVTVAGTISDNSSVTINDLVPGILRVVVFRAMPYMGAGTLFNFKFTAVGMAGQTSPLTFQTFQFNEGIPGDFTTNGLITLVGPTAAGVSVGGIVMSADGQAIPNARLTMTDQAGTSRTAVSNTFGFYRFDDVAVGGFYVINVRAKEHVFASRGLTVHEELTNLNLFAER